MSPNPLLENLVIRKAKFSDFDEVVELLIKFYTHYEALAVRVGVTDEDVRELVTGRTQTSLEQGICTVAIIDGKIEAVVSGIMLRRNEPYVPDYLHLSDRVYAIEGLCSKLTENLWNYVPQKFGTVCQMAYGLATPKAQGMRLGPKLVTLAIELCIEQGVYVLMSECLQYRTSLWAQRMGFVPVNYYDTSNLKDKNGKPFIENETSVLLLAFLDHTMSLPISKL